MSNITDTSIVKYVTDMLKSETSSWSGFVYGILALLSGLATTLLSKWMDKHKTKHEETKEDFETHLKASNELIENAKAVSDMARLLLKDQEELFQRKIEVAIVGAKEECNANIEKLKAEYQLTIETLVAKVKNLEKEKNELNEKVRVLEADNKILTDKLLDFQNRLKKYENIGTGPLSPTT